MVISELTGCKTLLRVTVTNLQFNEVNQVSAPFHFLGAVLSPPSGFSKTENQHWSKELIVQFH